jgi:hypothetical protein
MGEGEDLGRVCEWDWTFSWGVEHGKDIDEHSDQCQVDLQMHADQCTQTTSKEGPRHIWECE